MTEPTIDRGPIQRGVSLQDIVYGRVREIILSGEAGPGQPVTLRDLADRLGVSTMPVREAVRRLEGEGFLRFEPGRGVVITALTVDEMTEAFGIRLRLEPWAAEIAAARIAPAELDELEDLVTRMEARVESRTSEWRELNYQFHMGIYHASKMERLERVIAPLFAGVEGYLRLYVGTADSLAGPQHEHRELLESLRSHDGKRASQITAHHLSATMDSLLSVLDGSADIAAPRRTLGSNNDRRKG